ncbi:MAG: MBL fold metallo-hydrolase [Deltaproteobacteria bacterium]|nr:MAG: MBL fold metallo-hydrolase [Deltaproteobacteria bacterium]
MCDNDLNGRNTLKRKDIIGWRKIAFMTVFIAAVAACEKTVPTKPLEPAVKPDLAAHSAEFNQEVVEVTDGVYVAIGFGLANAILLEGSDGVIIVDTMESNEAAIPVKAAFDRISSKPVKAIIYTHYHPDHTFGAEIFAENNRPEIYAHKLTNYFLNRIVNVTRETTYRRAMRQFGTYLPPGELVNAGIGLRLAFDETNTIGILRPVKTFADESLKLEIAGLKLELLHAPGETDDQIFIWLPEKKVLLPADNYYKSFPNLYAIRGTAYRDVTNWINSIDKMRVLKPEYLIPGHTRPVVGAEKIYETLTNYRDAIQFVHDQTIRYMNAGFTPDEIVGRVKLPDHLARLPYLQEYYGTVEWSVRAIFNGYLGWFSGNATDLYPLSPQERAKRMVGLAGGEEFLLERTRQAVKSKDYQWALELADHLIRNSPNLSQASNLKAQALMALGEQQTASTARNYYLTQALEVLDKIEIEPRSVKSKREAHRIPLYGIFQSMAVGLNPLKSADVDMVAGFRFPDTGEAYTVHVRRSVAEIQPRLPQNPDISVTVNSLVWKEVATGLRNPTVALFKDMKKEGGFLKLVKFLALFKPDTFE